MKVNDELTQLFAFEDDFGDRLACLPMAVRYKLDTAGIKLHLKEWVGLPEDERRELLAWRCNTADDVRTFAARLTSVIEARTGRAPDRFAPSERPEWLDEEHVPDAVAWAAALGVKLSSAHWKRLTPLQRFALIKLSRPKHDAKKLRHALESSVLRKLPATGAVERTALRHRATRMSASSSGRPKWVRR